MICQWSSVSQNWQNPQHVAKRTDNPEPIRRVYSTTKNNRKHNNIFPNALSINHDQCSLVLNTNSEKKDIIITISFSDLLALRNLFNPKQCDHDHWSSYQRILFGAASDCDYNRFFQTRVGTRLHVSEL